MRANIICAVRRKTDSDSSYYDAEEGRQEHNRDAGNRESKSGSVNMRNIELINIDSLMPDHIKYEQDQQPEIRTIKQWKTNDEKPNWSEVAQYCNGTTGSSVCLINS